jgi:putative SOS response-associated peptidase YedK
MFDHYTLNPGLDFYQRFNIINRLPSFPKDINIIPGQIEPIINHQQGLILVWVMKWGLIPSWAKERGVGDRMFNVNAESVLTKLGFRQSFKNHRCLVPASKDGVLFSFAGIYDIWEEPVSGHEVYTYAIITNKYTSGPIPIILRRQDEQVWLNEKTPLLKLESLLRFSSKV